jgi:hypothetical protein
VNVVFYTRKEPPAPATIGPDTAPPAEHPLLAACTCMTMAEPPCPTCARWAAHYRMVTERHAAAIASSDQTMGER